MVGPSPCYINDGDYVGGFTREDIDGLLETLESNYLGWSSTMAPAIMGAPDQPELGMELTNSFCRTDPEIAKHFARVTFLSDHRADLPQLAHAVADPAVQRRHDRAAARSASIMQRDAAAQPLAVIENVGHCPHLSAPSASVAAMERFPASARAEAEGAMRPRAGCRCALLAARACGLLLTTRRRHDPARQRDLLHAGSACAAEALVDARRIQDLLTIGGSVFHQTHWAPLLQMQGSVAEVKLDIRHADGRTIPMLINAIRRSHDGQVSTRSR